MTYPAIRPLLYRQNRQLYKQIARALLLPLAIGLSLLSLLFLACSSSGDDSAAEQGEPAATGESSGTEPGEPYVEQGEAPGGESSVAQGEPYEAEQEGLVAICRPSQIPETARRIQYADPCSANPADLYSDKIECYLPQERPIDIRIEGTLPAYDRRVGAFFFPVAEEDSWLELSYSLPKQGSLYISSGSGGSGAAEELVTEETRLNVGELDLEGQASCRILHALYSDGTEERLALYLTSLPIVQLTIRESILYGWYDIRQPGSFHLNDPYFRRRYRTGRESHSCVALEGKGRNIPDSAFEQSWRMELRRGDADGNCSSDEERDIPLLGLYDDGDWVLRAELKPANHLRHRVAADVAADLLRFGHSHKEPDMAGGTRGYFAEIFINDRYHGIYNFEEKINRNLLQIKEDGFIERTANPLEAFGLSISFIQSDPDFIEQAEELFEIENLVDLHILINLLRVRYSSLPRNHYAGRYSSDSRLFFLLWDMDRTWESGNPRIILKKQDCIGCFMQTLLQRLEETSAASFRSRLKARWEELRRGLVTSELLAERFQSHALMWKQGGAAHRNQGRWSPPSAPLEQFRPETIDSFAIKVSEWIERQLELLDSYYSTIDSES